MLDIFRDNNPESAGSQPIPTGSISVAELQARRVHLEWFEAIAVVQAACKAIIDASEQAHPSTITAARVFLTPAGEVSVGGIRAKDASSAVRETADLLRPLLPDDNVPAPVRLALSQSSTHPTLVEFSKSLEFFERPNRSALVREVYERASTASVPAESSTAAPVAAAPATRPANVRRTPTRASLRRMLSVFAAVALVALAGLLGWRLWTSPPSPPTRESVTAAFDKVTSTVDNALDRVLPPRAPATQENATPAAQQPEVASPQRGSRNAATAPRVNKGDAATTNEASAGAKKAAADIASVSEGAGFAAFDLAAPPRIALEPAAPEPAAQPGQPPIPAVYSEADGDVIPPVAVYPQLPKDLPVGALVSDLAVIDLVIGPGGNVESVKLRRAPTTMSDAMLLTMSLSAAKAWRFDPATKDGQPVRYRKAIWLVMH